MGSGELGEGRGLGEEGSFAAMDAHDGAAAQEPGWIGAGGEDFEAAAVFALEVTERAGAGEVVGVVGAAAGAVLYVVEGYVALVADGAGAAVAIAAVDCFAFDR